MPRLESAHPCTTPLQRCMRQTKINHGTRARPEYSYSLAGGHAPNHFKRTPRWHSVCQSDESLAHKGETTTTVEMATYAYDQIEHAPAELNAVSK